MFICFNVYLFTTWLILLFISFYYLLHATNNQNGLKQSSADDVVMFIKNGPDSAIGHIFSFVNDQQRKNTI